MDTNGVNRKLIEFDSLCTQESPDRLNILRLWVDIDNKLVEIRASIKKYMEATMSVIAVTPEHPADAMPTESNPQEADYSPHHPGSNYETPTNAPELQKLLKTTFGVGNKSLRFSIKFLKRAMERAGRLETRGDWAVYCVLLDASGIMTAEELESHTGYNIGTVRGSLLRLMDRGLLVSYGVSYAVSAE